MINRFKDYMLFEFNDIRNKVDLQAEYDRLNKELFDGKLVRIPLKWEHIKKSGGRVLYTQYGNGRNATFELKCLIMSDFFDYDYDTFINALAHEMIHVYIVQNNIHDYGGSHGVMFRRKMDEINRKGYNITIKMDVTDVELNGEPKLSKPVCVLMVDDGKGTHSIQIWNYNLYGADMVEKIVNVLRRVAMINNKEYDVKFISSDEGFLKKYSIGRSLSKIMTCGISEDEWSKLLDPDNGNVVLHHEFIKK